MRPTTPAHCSFRSALPLAFPAAALLAACHHGDEVVVGEPGPAVYVETESNDDAWSADALGLLRAGEHLAVLGSIRDDAWDPQDGFELHAAGSIVVDFTLEPACGCADLDLWIYDPLLDAFVGAFDSPAHTEHGSFVVHGQPFHLVVVSAHGHADYRLDVRASGFHPLAAGGAGAAPAIVLAPRPEAAESAPQAAAPDVAAPDVAAPHAGASDDARSHGAAKPAATAPEDYRAAARRTGPGEPAVLWILDPAEGVVGRGDLALPLE